MRSLDRLLLDAGGVLPLRPTLVRRFYRDAGRLGVRTMARDGAWRPERWIASTVAAANPRHIPGEGLSEIRIPGRVTLRAAIARRPDELVGAGQRTFDVLVKILDPLLPIVFHFHATDAQVRRMPRRFPGHRFGKDEAYYFLDAPKATCPYTHAGLARGVKPRDLERALASGSDAALELSPSFLQRVGEGFFVPAGVPHRPGTALTLEIQQPSNVYTLLETHANGRRLSARQAYPGFASLGGALALVDFPTSTRADFVERHHLAPEIVRRERGIEEAWIFPPRVTRKFSGKRVRVAPGRAIEIVESTPYALFVWRGQGMLGRVPVAARPGRDEFFVGAAVATRPHRLRATGRDTLEAFLLFPPALG
ncbi:MAG: hypothetical protein HYR85_21195 [Planctomycetes bacterium]|nr:hypothetical protein [Planctomycetota bacterium]